MPALGLNTRGYLYKVIGRDQADDPTYAAPVATNIAIVMTKDFVQQTPIRSEASASHGRADEDMGPVTILMAAIPVPSVGDRVDFTGMSSEVISVTARQDNFGRLNHYEVMVRALYVTGATSAYTPVIF
jgi:hypothetical protein